jgi:sialate O-acetylesterase
MRCLPFNRGIIFLLLVFYTSLANAQLRIPAIFSDNMVLQRDKPLTIWGSSTPGVNVTVSFAAQQQTVQSSITGKWQIVLSPLQTSSTPQDLIVKSDSTITFHNVLVGDVWLCTGQSNMEYPMDRKWKRYAMPAKGGDTAADELQKTGKPDAIRYLYVERTLDKAPLLPTKGWNNGNDTTTRFVSAIGYFFAKEIYEQTKIPIGIISSSWGGTRIEQWTPDWSYQLSPVFKDSVKGFVYKIDGMHPGQMYKGMIEPLIPYAIKGVLWYQGESNCMIEDQATYPEKFRIFVKSWRDQFKDDKLPFYTVQIAPYLYTARKDPKKHVPELLPEFWEAQTKCLSVIPFTEMIVTTDLTDNLSDIHPSYKWTVAHRLALVALAKNYGKTSLVYSGPLYKSMKRKKSEIELSFTHIGSGLAISDTTKPLTWFTIAGEDGKFVPATAVIEGDKIIVSAAEVPKPRQVRFAWHETAQPNFINKEGLPAVPFQTGDR